MNAYKTIEKKYRNNKNIKFMFSTHHLGGKIVRHTLLLKLLI